MLWIDTDAGIDDFVALLILSCKRDSFIVKGISIVDGNVNVSSGVAVCEFLNDLIVSGDIPCFNKTPIPFYIGAQGPLIKDVHTKYR